MKASRASRAGAGAGAAGRAAKKEKALSTTSQIKLFLRALTYPLSYPLYLLSLYATILVSSMLHTYEPGYGEHLVYILSQENAAEMLKPAIYHRIQIELLIAGIECISSYLQSELSTKVERKMQEEFYKCLLAKDAEYHDGKKVGDLTSKMTQDLQSVKALAIMDMAGLFSKIFNIGWSLMFMMQISPRLTMILAIVIAPRVGLMWSVKDHFRNAHRNIMKLKGENNSIVTEAFINIRTVKTFSSEEKEFEKFQQKLGQYHAANKSLAQKDMVLNIVRAILKTVMFGTVALQGGALVLEIKEFTAFDLARFISYTRQFSMATLTLETNIKKMIGSIVNAESIFEELDMKPKVNPNKEKIAYEKGVRGEILFKDVSFSYPQKKEVQVLKKLNLEIKKGEHIAIVGESGGGKSTITSLLQRLYDPTEGEIQIDGKNLKEYNLEWLHSKMGYISQEPSLFTGTIEENVVYGVKNYEEKELEKAVEGAYMRKFVDDKKIFPEGMKSYVGERGNKLSGGQKQRVAIARALIKNPDIMILDEATSALDAESEHQIMKGFEELLKNKGQTVIVIAHRLSTIMHCDRILVVQNGEIIETGNHQELVEKGGAYKNLVEKQLVGGSGNGSGSESSPMRRKKDN